MHAQPATMSPLRQSGPDRLPVAGSTAPAPAGDSDPLATWPVRTFGSDRRSVRHLLLQAASCLARYSWELWLPSLLRFIDKHIDTVGAEGGVR